MAIPTLALEVPAPEGSEADRALRVWVKLALLALEAIRVWEGLALSIRAVLVLAALVRQV